MLHTHDDFLGAIEADPADRTLRLVFADWLDEHADPRGELIRVEEQMRELPVFADRFWELKPRRNELRARAGADWCGRMRYGTECEPVFRHGVPDGWRDRWRLIREFTERWHRVPMPDVGGRQAEIADAESRLGRTLPPSVREWIAFACDGQQIAGREHNAFWNPYLNEVAYYATLSNRDRSVIVDPDDECYYGVRFADCGIPDPPVHFMPFGTPSDQVDCAQADGKTVTGYTLIRALTFLLPGDLMDVAIGQPGSLREQLTAEFGAPLVGEGFNFFEASNILVTVSPTDWGVSRILRLRVVVAEGTRREQVPSFLWNYTRNGGVRGIFATPQS